MVEDWARHERDDNYFQGNAFFAGNHPWKEWYRSGIIAVIYKAEDSLKHNFQITRQSILQQVQAKLPGGEWRQQRRYLQKTTMQAQSAKLPRVEPTLRRRLERWNLPTFGAALAKMSPARREWLPLEAMLGQRSWARVVPPEASPPAALLAPLLGTPHNVGRG